MADNKSSLNESLKALLAIANVEQDMHFPPSVFSSIYNSVSSWLLTKVAEAFPTNNRVVDIAEPFLMTEVKKVVNGYVELPNTYRNFLNADIAVAKNGDCECGEIIKSAAQEEKEFNEGILRAGCERRPLLIVDQSEWAYRTTDPFDRPTMNAPIGCFFGSKKIKVCPFDITTVEVKYLKNEMLYVMGYTTQPDDSWIYNPTTTIESEWGNNAFSYLLKGLVTCYSAYAENQNLRDFSNTLKTIGLL